MQVIQNNPKLKLQADSRLYPSELHFRSLLEKLPASTTT